MTRSRRRSTHQYCAQRLLMVAVAGLAIAMLGGTPISQAAPPDPGASGADHAVSIAAFAFGPADTSVPAGATVTWTNAQDGVPHTTTSPDGVWDSGVLSTNDAFSFTFNDTGDFAYQCSIHPSMHGIVHVTPSLEAALATSQNTDAPSPALAGPSEPRWARFAGSIRWRAPVDVHTVDATSAL